VVLHRYLDRKVGEVVTATLGPRGDFGHLCAVGAFEPSLEDAHRLRTYHGLVTEALLCYGAFRDDKGGLYAIRRTLGMDWGRPLFIHSNRPGGGMTLDQTAAEGSWWGPGLKEEQEESSHTFRGPAAVNEFSLRRRNGEIEWEDGEWASLRGNSLSAGVQWYDATTPGASYASLFYRARGRILGVDVEGFLVFDHRYLPPGHAWSEAPYETALQRAWTVFAVEWDDGAIEGGHLCSGGSAWSFALLINDLGDVIAETGVESTLTMSGQHPSTVTYVLRDEKWEWTTDPSGTLEPAPGDPVSIRAAEGLLRRDGERRSPRVWMARTETASFRG
jgi:hypothetical protein